MTPQGNDSSAKGPPVERRRRRRTSRRVKALIIGGLVVVFLLASVVVLRVRFNGPGLARTLENTLNERIRGKVEIGSVEWPLSSLYTAVRGGWIPVTIHDLKVWDDGTRRPGVTERKLILDVPKVTAEIDAHSLILGSGQDFVMRNVVVHGGWAIVEEVPEPYPVHEYDLDAISLLSAFYGMRPPGYSAGLAAYSDQIFDLRNWELRDVRLEFVFPAFTAVAESVDGHGFLYASFEDPLRPILYFGIEGEADTGSITVDDMKAEFTNIKLPRLEQLPTRWPASTMPSDTVWEGTADVVGGGEMKLVGGMYDWWESWLGGEYQTELTIDRANGLLRSLTDDVAGGDDVFVYVDVSGPVLRPKYKAMLSHLDLDVPLEENKPPLSLSVESATVAYDEATQSGYVENTVARGAGGEVQLSATFGLDPYAFDLHVGITEAIEMRPYIPSEIAVLTGTRLRGRMHAFGNDQVQRLDHLDLHLGAAHITGELVRQADEKIHAELVRARLGQTELTTRGVIDYVSETFDLAVGIRSRDLPRWLRRYDVPAIAGSLDGSGRVKGSLSDPRADLSLSFGGVPVISRADADLSYAGGIIDIRSLRSNTLDGSVDGSGRVAVGGRTRVLGFTARARNLDLSLVPTLGGLVSGRLDADVTASGPTDRLDAELDANAKGLTIAGDRYTTATLHAEGEPDGMRSVNLDLERERGGALSVQGVADRQGRINGALRLESLPLHSMAMLAGDEGGESPIGGILGATITVDGTLDEPTADGTISLVRSWIGNAFIGAADIELTRTDDGKVEIAGRVMQGKIDLVGTVETQAPFRAELQLGVRRVEIDQFVPGLAEEHGIRGWVSGEIAVVADLASDAPPSIDARLDEAVVLIDSEDSEGRPAPVRLRNLSPIAFSYDGVGMTIVPPAPGEAAEAVFSAPGGDLVVSGGASPDELALHVAGELSLASLQPYLREYFARTEGRVRVAADLTGSLSDPGIKASIEVLEEVWVRPEGQDAVVTMPAGVIEIDNDTLFITGVRIGVRDQVTRESAELTAGGTVVMENFTPTQWAVKLGGKLAGKVLLVVAPKIFSQAGGVAYIDEDEDLWLLGDSASPEITGTIVFDPATPFTFTPRGLRREVALNGGRVRIEDSRVLFEDVTGTVDDEGRFIIGQSSDCDELTPVRCSEVTIADWEPESIDLTISADALPFRIPGELDVTFNLAGLRVLGGWDGLEAVGTVEIIDGRYSRNYNLAKELRPETTPVPPSPSVFDEVPVLGNAKLDLQLDVRGFFVKNNLANIELAGEIAVGGTPREPEFDGEITVEQGQFKIPTLRAKFTRTRGSVVFSKFQDFPDDTPSLNISSEADYTDPTGRTHIVTLALRGPLSAMQWDLFTSTGLAKNQAITMLFSGRTPEELRKSIGDTAIGGDPTRPDQTASTTGDNVADQLLKDLAGDLISLYLEDTLRNITTLDVARLEIGTGSIGFHGEKNVLKNVRIIGDFEQSLRGRTLDVRGQFRLTDRWGIEGSVTDTDYADETEEDRSDFRGRIVYRFLIP